jgi:hypothetical protein
MAMVQVSKMPKTPSRSDHHDQTAYSVRITDRVPFPCFQPNRPDPNVLTEVDRSSDFPALESARKAAYIGKLWPAGGKFRRLQALTRQAQTIVSASETGLLRISDCTPFPENAEQSQQFVNAFCKTGVSPAKLSVVWLTSLFQFRLFAESTRTIHRQRNSLSRLGFILLASNSSTTLCYHYTRQLNRTS